VALILTVLTPEVVVQVWEREDPGARAVVWRGRLAFAYSGLGDMGHERNTAAWLDAALKDAEAAAVSAPRPVDVSDLLAAVADRATEYFRRPRIRRTDRRLRRHAFVAAGWARFGDEPERSPYLALISNHHREGSELAAAQPAFDAYVRRLPPGQRGHVLPIGAHVAEADVDGLAARLAETEGDPGRIVEVLRAVVDADDPVVCVLPEPDGEAAGPVLADFIRDPGA
jgi:hypothetical protein